MINLCKKIALVSTFVISSFAFSNAAFAGADAWLPGKCVAATDPLTGAAIPNTMACSGVFADIHNQGNDATRYASFLTWVNPVGSSEFIGQLMFAMQYNGKGYMCTTNPTPQMVQIWQTIQAGSRVSWSVTFNTTSGSCTGASVYAGSQFHLQ